MGEHWPSDEETGEYLKKRQQKIDNNMGEHWPSDIEENVGEYWPSDEEAEEYFKKKYQNPIDKIISRKEKNEKIKTISETETRKKGGKRKEITEKKIVTETETITQTVIVSKDKKEDNNKKERKIEDGQQDLEGNDAILNQIIKGQKEIGVLCKQVLDYFKENLLIKDDNMIYVPYAALASHMYPGDTVWVIIVSQSSGSKSEILRSMGETRNDFVYPISRITQNAVISGGKGDIGLVYEANNKVVIIKDLVTAITSKNAEGIFSQIREAFDGNVNVSSGYEEGSKSKPDIRITIIAGVTPDAISGNTIFNSALGERFIYYMYPKFDMEDIDTLAKKMMGGPDDDKRRKEAFVISDKLIRKVFELRKLCFKNNIKATIGDIEYGKWLYRLGAFVAILRRSVKYNWKASAIEDVGTEEGPHRITKELLRISVGLAMVKQKPIKDVIDVDEEIKDDIKRICIDSIPRRRFMCLKIFLDEQKEMIKRQKDVMVTTIKNRMALEFGFSRNTARLIVNELAEMNILRFYGDEDNEGDYRIVRLNENFAKDHGKTLSMLIEYMESIENRK